MNQERNNLRMATVRWIGRLLAVALDVGALTVGEYNIVMKALKDIAKKGETIYVKIREKLQPAKIV